MAPVKGLHFRGLALLYATGLTPKGDKPDGVTEVEHYEDTEVDWSDEGENQEDVHENTTVNNGMNGIGIGHGKNGDAAADNSNDSAHIVKACPTSDARLKELKLQAYSDAAVADRLSKEGYKILAKTVTARWRRIKAADDKEADEKLDDELSDWHEGEDDQLCKAYAAADARFNKEVEKLEQVRWKNVRQSLAANLNKDKYSAKACKERYEALLDGTAELPIEQDPDKEGRAKKRKARIAENKRRRAEEKAEAEFAASEKKRAAEEERARKLNHRVNVMQYREQRKMEKAEDLRIRKEAARGREMERQRRAKALARVRAEAAEKKRVKLVEDRVYQYYTGKSLIRKGRGGGKTGHALDDSEEEDDVEDFFHDDDSDDADTAAADSVIGTEVKDANIVVKFEMPAIVTKATLLNARSIMTMDELEALLYVRGLKRRGPVESHPEVVARLAAADKELKSFGLDLLLGKHFSRVKGNMATRIEALQKADAATSVAGMKGWTVEHPEFRKNYEGYRGKYGYLVSGQ